MEVTRTLAASVLAFDRLSAATSSAAEAQDFNRAPGLFRKALTKIARFL